MVVFENFANQRAEIPVQGASRFQFSYSSRIPLRSLLVPVMVLVYNAIRFCYETEKFHHHQQEKEQLLNYKAVVSFKSLVKMVKELVWLHNI